MSRDILALVSGRRMTATLAAILTLLAVAAYGALHSALATLWMKARARRWFGPASERVYRLGYNVIGAVTLLPVLAIPAIEPGPTIYRVPSPLSLLFLAGQGAAALVIVIGILQTDAWHFLGLRQLTESGEQRPAPFVTSGLYRYVRHPLYSAGLIFLWLTPWMTTSILALYFGLSAYLYIGSLFEERRLEAEFGQAYVEYRHRVPRLIPRLHAPPPPGAAR
jgi:protein-S-isoprenylcysteine O-methyltransferase Ste14